MASSTGKSSTAVKKPQPPSPRRDGPAPKGNNAASSRHLNAGGAGGSRTTNDQGGSSGFSGTVSEFAGKYFVELPGGQWLDASMFPLSDLQKVFGHDKVYSHDQMVIAMAGGDPHAPSAAAAAAVANGTAQGGSGSAGGRHSSLFSRLASSHASSSSPLQPKPPGGLSPGRGGAGIGVNPSRSPVPPVKRSNTDDDDDDELIGGMSWADMLQKPLQQRQQIILSELQQHRKHQPLTISQLSSLRSQSNNSLTPDQISPRLRLLPSLEFCPSAKRFVLERLQLLRTDDFLRHDFMNKVKCIDIAERVERHGGAEHSEEYFLAQNAQREVKHSAFLQEHHHRMVSARLNYVVQWTQRREELVNLNNVISERSARADSNRSFAGAARAMARQWVTIVLLYVSQHKFKSGLLVGYRKKWHVLARNLMLLHWRNVTRRHKRQLQRFRVNFLIRKLIPRWHRAMKERLREVHMDRVKHFLHLICHAQRFVRVIRTFMYHVKHAQRIIRRRRVARSLIMTALCIRFDTCNLEMINDPSVGVYFPPELRNLVVKRLMEIETQSWLEDRTERLEMYLQELDRTDRNLSTRLDHPVFEQSLLVEGAMVVAARFPLLARDSCVKSILREFRQGKKLTAADKSSLKTWVGQLYLELKNFEASWERSLAAAHAAGTPASTTSGKGVRGSKRRSTFENVTVTTSPSQASLLLGQEKPANASTFLTAVPPSTSSRKAIGSNTTTTSPSLPHDKEIPVIMIAAADAVETQEKIEAAAEKTANNALVTESSISPAALALPAGAPVSSSSGSFILRVLLRDEARRRVLRTIVTDDRNRLSRHRSSLSNLNAAAAAARGGGGRSTGVVSVKQRLARCANGSFPLTDPSDDCYPLFSSVPLPKFMKRKNLIDKRSMQMLLRSTKDAWITASKQLALDKISSGDVSSSEGAPAASASVALQQQRLSVTAQRKQSIQDRISADKKVYDMFMETYKKHHPTGNGAVQTSAKDLAMLALVDLSFLDGFFRRLR